MAGAETLPCGLRPTAEREKVLADDLGEADDFLPEGEENRVESALFEYWKRRSMFRRISSANARVRSSCFSYSLDFRARFGLVLSRATAVMRRFGDPGTHPCCGCAA